MSKDQESSAGLNILCIALKDGGGARGLSSLVVLKEVMHRLGPLKQSGEPLVPADHFDYIAGSGTGGVSACMLGKLRMSIDKTIEEYEKLMKNVFTEKKLLTLGSAAYKATKLQQALGSMVREATGNEEETMLGAEGDNARCRTAVFAMSKKNMNAGLPTMFRSYRVDADPSPDCTIREALRATMAHPDLFKSIDISDLALKQSFVGGEIGCNNPIAHVLSEVKKLYPNRHVACILSIGAGHARTIQVPDPSPLQRIFRTQDVVVMKQMATDSERVAEEMGARFKAINGVYFRFNVDQGMQTMLPGSWEKLSDVLTHTKMYLRKPAVGEAIEQVVQSISERRATIATEFIDGQIPGRVIKQLTKLRRCPAPTPVYTGRDTESDQLESCLTRSDNGRCICVVSGLGGVGKTQLALKVIERTRDKWDCVIYVDASSEGSIKKTLEDLANAKGIGETHEDAISWLESYHERWLLFLDNADDRSLVTGIRQYIPGGHRGKIIITTRLADMAVFAVPGGACHLSSMNQEDGLALLLKTARLEGQTLSNVEREAAIALLQDFGCLALAIVHAGAYIGHVRSVSIAKYRDLFRSRRHDMLEHSGRLHGKIDDYGKPVYATWKLCYDLLQESSKQMLWLIAFLHHSHINEDLFKRAAHNIHLHEFLDATFPTEIGSSSNSYLKKYLSTFLDSEGHWDTVRFTNVMADLTSCSLVDFDQMNLAYSIHILVQDWVRTAIPQTPEFALGCTATLLSMSIFDLQDDAESFVFERQLWLHVNNIIERKYKVGEGHECGFAYLLLRMGQWDQAERLAKRGVDTYSQVLGEKHLAAWESKIYLALLSLSLGRHEEAEKIGVQALNESREALGEGHPTTLKSKQCVSQIYTHLGRLDEAKQLQIQTLQAYRRRGGVSLPEILISMITLAQIHSQSAEWDNAAALWADILNAQKQFLSEEHPDIMDTMCHLAIAYSFQGRHDEAEQLQVQILKASERMWRESHPRMLASMATLALNHTVLGRLEEARQLQVRIMNTHLQLLGEEHPDTLKSMHRAAMTYVHLGRSSEAKSLLTTAVDISERKLGSEHPDTQLYRSCLASAKTLMNIKRNQIDMIILLIAPQLTLLLSAIIYVYYLV